MVKPRRKTRSEQIADRMLKLNPTDLKTFARQLPSQDLAEVWGAIAPWQCRAIWERVQRVNHCK